MTCQPIQLAPRKQPLPHLNRLEGMGLRYALGKDLAISSGEAEMLALLLESAGRFVSCEALADCRSSQRDIADASTLRGRVCKLIGRVRKALMDLGFPPSVIENHPALGYAIAKHHAARIWEGVVI